MTERLLDVSPTSRELSHQPSAIETRTVDTTARARTSFVDRLLVPGPLCPRHLGEERVDGPEVPGGLVAADAVAGIGQVM